MRFLRNSSPGFVRRQLSKLRIRLRDRRTRRKFTLYSSAIFLVAVVGFIGGLRALETMEEPVFCASCHAMAPEATVYEKSVHARNNCVNCHVGYGLPAFVNAKVNGQKQLLQVLSNSYPRPVEAPVKNLRPATETCEKCHWPRKFSDSKIRERLRFQSDITNTPSLITMTVKIGGGLDVEGRGKGIHWHTQNNVWYIASDEKRQVIEWVRARNAAGEIIEFVSDDARSLVTSEFIHEAEAKGELRLMGCYDCHNRVAHAFQPPELMVDEAMRQQKLDPDLPFLKKQAVELLSVKYPTLEAAVHAINGLEDYYKKTYPSIYVEKAAQVRKAVRALKEIFEENVFPEMKVDWQTYPDNVGHKYTPGCFRCHDGKHGTWEDGKMTKVIPANCTLCHSMPVVSPGTPVVSGSPPTSHSANDWVLRHRGEAGADCQSCHARQTCMNAGCHPVNHPEDWRSAHPKEVKASGSASCQSCHQSNYCISCHNSRPNAKGATS